MEHGYKKDMKKIIRLTESDLHRIVKESVRKILRECGTGMINTSMTNPSMVEDDVDEEGGATNAQSSGQVLKGSGLSINPNDEVYRREPGGVGNMGKHADWNISQ
jgi:hypothetical protein